MRCQEFREILDSYLSGELLVETNHEILRHLESCAACRSELSARREWRARLRSAIKSAPEMNLNPNFAARLSENLRETALHPTVWEKLRSARFGSASVIALAAACLLLILLFGVNRLRKNTTPENVQVQEKQINQMNELVRPSESPLILAFKAAWEETTRQAIGDHKNCALHFNLEEKPISLKQAAEKYGNFNRDLDKTVMASLKDFSPEKKSGEIKLLAAHSCVFQGRRFAHVILLQRNRKISVLVTDFDTSGAADESVSSLASGQMIVARFRAGRHAVFVVSDLPTAENVAIAEKISPAVRRHIERAETGI